jgi:hypothetical protein
MAPSYRISVPIAPRKGRHERPPEIPAIVGRGQDRAQQVQTHEQQALIAALVEVENSGASTRRIHETLAAVTQG